MQRKWAMGGAALFAMVLFTQVVRAGDQDFTLVNKTGFEIHKVYVGAHDSDSWGEDVLGKTTLADGDRVEIKFSKDEEAEVWDLQIVDKEGNTITWKKLRLTKISKIILHYEDGKATAVIE